MSEFAVPQKTEDAGRLDRVNLALAALLFLSPWLLGYASLSTIASVTAWISAAAIALVATVATLHFAEWEEWLSLLGGVWLVAAPWVLHFAYLGVALAGFTGIGLFIIAISVTEIYAVHHPGWLEKDVRRQ